MCSKVSIDLTFMNGVEVLVVDRRGKGLLNPQSPLFNDDWGVVTVRWVGYGRVAESELKIAVEERSGCGWGRGDGIEKTLEARRSAPPGDTLREAIVDRKGLDVDVLNPRIAGPKPHQLIQTVVGALK